MTDVVAGRAPSPFDRLRARGLLGWFLLSAIGTATAAVVAGRLGNRHPDQRVIALLVMLAVLVTLVVRTRWVGLDWRRLFGPLPDRGMLPLVLVVAPVGMITFGTALLVFVPLSYVFPRFVARQFLSISFFEVTTVSQWLLLTAGAVVAAPLVEEMFFRGILLHRWARRWGTLTGVLTSSALFAVGHSEIFGHFLFGVAMAALYLHTRRLWVPIAAHALNNFVLVLPILAGILTHRQPEKETLASFRKEIWLAPPFLLVGAILLLLYLRRFWPGDLVRTTLRGPVPYDVAEGAHPVSARE